MGGQGKPVKVLIVGDWDADGVVAAAEVYYAQSVAKRFPYAGDAIVDMAPSGPRGLSKRLAGCSDYLVVLDIPVTAEVLEALSHYRSRCSGAIVYVDHHDSTEHHSEMLEKDLKVLVIAGDRPTSVLVREVLAKMGVRLHRRLERFVGAVAALEGGGRPSDVPKSFLDATASLSKLMNVRRDEEVWRALVKWIASPMPEGPLKLPGIGEVESIVDISAEIAEEADKEVEDAAVKLAMSAMQVGGVAFIDARKRWRRPGATALASHLHKIMKTTVAVLIERDDGARVLVLRSSRGEAKEIMEELRSMGIVEDVGGHSNVATGRLSEEATVKRLVDSLRRASINVIVRRRRMQA